ncbi:MAG: GNAT family N-acetyltransferase [Eubacteriales bacterium]|nr:GNAT family N-acetyltransferase [Eubacteriales bacterium]
MHRVLRTGETDGVVSLLLKDEIGNAFLLGNLLAVGIKQRYHILRSGYYYGFFTAEGVLGGVLALYNNSQCMLYCDRPEVALEMAHFLYQNPSRTIIGPKGTMEAMAEAVPLFRQEMCLGTQYFMVQETPQQMDTQIRLEDVRRRWRQGEVLVFISRCLEECFGFRTPVGIVRRILKERVADEAYFIAYVDKTPVAQAHIQAWTPHYGQIGGVGTLCQFRRRGYGKQTVAQAAAYVRGKGRTPFLLVDDDNEDAKRLYEQVSFTRRADIAVWQPK